MLNEWSDREPDPEERPWIRRVVAVLVALAVLVMLVQLAMWAVGSV